MKIKKYLNPNGTLNKKYTDKDFEGTGWHYIPVSLIKENDKLFDTAQKQGESYYLANENGDLVPSDVVNNFLKNKELNLYFTELSDANDRISQQMRLRAADREANRKSPGAGTFVVAPLALTAAGIGGATVLPYLLPGTIGSNIIGTTAFGEALNHAIKYGTGKTMGEHAVNAAHFLGIPQSLWGDFGIQFLGDTPLYVGGDLIGKTVTNAGQTLGKEVLDKIALNKVQLDPSKYGAKAWTTSWYNNITPGSYSAKISWHPKGKIFGEIPSAVKDYISGKGAVKNPKWELYFLSEPLLWQDFPNGSATELHTALRKEAAELYNGLERSTHYLIDTGKVDENGYKIFTLDLEKIPKRNVLDFVLNVSPTKNKSGITDDLANFGGNVRYTTNINPEQHTFQITSDDIFDVHPLENPNRIAESLPPNLRSFLFKKITNPEGSHYPYSYTHKWYTKPFKHFELGQLTGAKPFRVITTIDGKFVSEYPFKTDLSSPIEKTLAKNKLITLLEDNMINLVPWEELSEQEIIQELNLIKEQATKYVEGLSDELLLEKLQGRMSASLYSDKTGLITFPSEEYGTAAEKLDVLKSNIKGGKLIPRKPLVNKS